MEFPFTRAVSLQRFYLLCSESTGSLARGLLFIYLSITNKHYEIIKAENFRLIWQIQGGTLVQISVLSADEVSGLKPATLLVPLCAKSCSVGFPWVLQFPLKQSRATNYTELSTGVNVNGCSSLCVNTWIDWCTLPHA